MTELEQLLAMLQRAGIRYERHEDDYTDGDTLIEVHGGYAGFYAHFRFSAAGQLKEIGAYE